MVCRERGHVVSEHRWGHHMEEDRADAGWAARILRNRQEIGGEYQSAYIADLRAHRMGNVHFRNQHAIGNYIVDFCVPCKKLIIELDGSQHLEQKEYDEERTKYLELHGYRVLRFWNNNVMNNIDDVLRVIWSVLKDEKGDETKKKME